MTTDADAIIALYRRHAQAWTALRGDQQAAPPMEAAWLDRFLALLPTAAAVLDLGCGPGAPMARYLAERACDITGVDSAPEMIAIARGRLPEHTWHVADMRTLAMSEKFDGILAWDSFFHLTPEDQRSMFSIFRDHAAPRAALMFTSGPAHGVVTGTLEGETLYHASLAPAEYRARLVENGFGVRAYAAEDATCGGHTIWLAQRE